MALVKPGRSERFIEDFKFRIKGLEFTPEQAIAMIREVVICQRVPSVTPLNMEQAAQENYGTRNSSQTFGFQD